MKHLLLSISLFLIVGLFAQKPRAIQPFELNPDAKTNLMFENNRAIDLNTRQAVSYYGLNEKLVGNSIEEMARLYLQQNAQLLGLQYANLQDLSLDHLRSSDVGHVVRFQQLMNEVKVANAHITLNITADNRLVMLHNHYKTVQLKNWTNNINAESAIQLAKQYINVSGEQHFEAIEQAVYTGSSQHRLAYEVVILAANPHGEWHVWVDAETEEVFKCVNEAAYCKHFEPGEGNETEVDGTGNVFDPDPLSSAQVAYGTGGYTDNNDANSADLTSQTFVRTLFDLTQNGGMFELKGPFAEVVDFESPFNGLYAQNSSTFSFQRQDDAFEAVNGYFHIDGSMRYINNVLNCAIMPYQYNGGVQFDPHGVNGADNSYYTSGSGQLSFGEGCVDDAEDSDVLHHELGHGIHDWVTNGGLSQVDGLSEGCGDYWAQSYNRSLGNWTSADPQYNWIFNWDGHNVCWNGRISDYTAVYPAGLTGAIHTDGQIWSTCMMKVWDLVGHQATDKIFLEGLGMTNGNSSQNDAAVAVYQAAINLGYAQSDIQNIHTTLSGCGYTLPPLPGPPAVQFEADPAILCLDNANSISFSDLSIGSPTSWEWSFPGGTPSISNMQNPTITYSVTGTYDVQLIATNSHGSDTLSIQNYISVVSGNDCPSCFLEADNSLPLSIPTQVATVSTSINISFLGTITDVNVIDFEGTHSWINDLRVTLTSPQGTTVELFNQICFNEDDFDIDFDDDAPNANYPCPPTDGMPYQPSGNLSDFNGENAQGSWILSMEDLVNQDGGSLENWDLEICIDSAINCNIGTTTSSQAEDCVGQNGEASVTVSGATNPISYLWSNGATTSSIDGLISGTYDFTVTDANGCQAFGQIPVPVVDNGPVLTLSNEDVSCFDAADGSAMASVQFGTAPYDFDWSNGSTTQSISGLAAGSYDATVTDDNGCSSQNSVQIAQPNQLILGLENDTATSNDGELIVDANGGTAPYSYSWSNGATSHDIDGLDAGTYTVTVTDANGCEEVIDAEVIQLSSLRSTIADQLFIYPNPNNRDFIIDCTNCSNLSIEEIRIYDVLGKEQLFELVESNHGLVHIQHQLATGNYLLSLQANSIVISKKLLIH